MCCTVLMTKQNHFSSRLEPLEVTTAAEDFKHFAFRGRFPNDGTFPVTDSELLDARYHSLDEESEVSIAMARNFQSSPNAFRRHGSSTRSKRGVLREYFEQCAGERDMSTHEESTRYDPKEISCQSTTITMQTHGLASGGG